MEWKPKITGLWIQQTVNIRNPYISDKNWFFEFSNFNTVCHRHVSILYVSARYISFTCTCCVVLKIAVKNGNFFQYLSNASTVLLRILQIMLLLAWISLESGYSKNLFGRCVARHRGCIGMHFLHVQSPHRTHFGKR